MVTNMVLAAQKGDDNAFYQLVSFYKNQLYRIAFRYLKNEQGTLDAIQETTFRAYKNLKKLKRPEYFQTWLIRILINVCQDEQKHLKLQIPYELGQCSSLSGVSDDRNEPGGFSNLQRLEIQMVLEKMDIKYRQIIELKYFEDLTLREIAEILERPEGTIKTWLNQALKLLRERLGERGSSDV